MPLFSESADVSVRPALAEDAAAIATVQRRAWAHAHRQVLGQEVLDALDPVRMQAGWSQAVSAPPGPGHRVLVACAGAQVVGFAAFVPSTAQDDDVEIAAGELVALEVDPDHQRGGHGSRLLAATVDLLREDGAAALTTWVLDGDEARIRFLSSTGFGPDGAVRDLAVGPDGSGHDRAVRENRWGALI